MKDDMDKPLTATELRANVCRILDEVIETSWQDDPSLSIEEPG